MAIPEVFHFDEFTLDVGERRLLRGTETVRLSPKACDVLIALVRQSGRLVTKDELLAQVWPESFVEEGILNVHVAALRKALGDDTRPPAYIETVVRSGYRFIAAVTCDLAHEKPLTPSAITRPVELYEQVGRGRSHLLSGSYFELPAAVDAFRSAIEIDPTYAPAHAGLARARCLQAVFRAVPHQEAFAEAKASALRALAMDAQVALGTVLFLSEWDWTAAERSLCRALEINPDHTEALLQYGSLQEALGRSTMGCAASNRRSRAIRDRPAFWCRSPSRIGINGSTTTRLSGLGGRWRSTRSICWRANSLTTSIGRSGTSIDSRPGPRPSHGAFPKRGCR
jgi:DNA-binding winged helix-turn-helix (wHTH) protein